MADPTTSGPARHVLIVNQHGDNTGDEAALRAMLTRLEAELGRCQFTVVHQFREATSQVAVPQQVRWLPMRMTVLDAIRLALYAISLALRLPLRRLLGGVAADTVGAYESADLVISAPGGPYFGDIYWSHEPVHWFYVWLAHLHRKPIALYAPSAGPFDKRWLSPFRRWVYRSFDVLTLRENQSADHVRDLLGGSVRLEVTADSALAEKVEPLPRDGWALGDGNAHDRFLLAVSVIRYAYPGDADPEARRQHHDQAVVDAMTHVAARVSPTRPVHVVFMPQLRSRRHDDTGYLQSLARRLPEGTSWEVLGPELSSDEQRARIASADLVLAGRYHPAIFAISARVPVVCIAYEHKALGAMESAGLSDLTTTIEDLDSHKLRDMIDGAIDHAADIRERLAESEPRLRARARRTAELCAELLRSAG